MFTGLLPLRLMKALELSQTKVPTMFVTAAPPVLQMRTPI